MKKNLFIIVLLLAAGAGIGAVLQKMLSEPVIVERRVTVQLPAPPPIERTVYRDRMVRVPYDTSRFSQALDSLASTLVDCRRQLILAWEPMSYFQLFGRERIVAVSEGDSVALDFEPDRVDVTYAPLDGRSVVKMSYGGSQATFYRTPAPAQDLPFFKGIYAKVGMYSAYGEGFLDMGKKAYALQFGMTFQSQDFQAHLAPFGAAVYPVVDRSSGYERTTSAAAYGWSLEGQWYFLK